MPELKPGRPRGTRPIDRIVLNVPPDLGAALRRLAERERRPVSTQVVLLLERLPAVRREVETVA